MRHGDIISFSKLNEFCDYVHSNLGENNSIYQSLLKLQRNSDNLNIEDIIAEMPNSITGTKIENQLFEINESILGNYIFEVEEHSIKDYKGPHSFTECTIPKELYGNSITHISELAFEQGGTADNLIKIIIPDSVTDIDTLFYGCTSLISITVNSNNSNYSSSNGILFDKNNTTLIRYPAGKTSTSYTIPNSVTDIDTSAFGNCVSLTTITIPNSVTDIGAGAFANCSSLTNITLPNSVTSINDAVFGYCVNLTSVTIPNSVTSIGIVAFQDCDKLTDVYYKGTEEEWNKISISEGNEALLNATIHYIQ